jgi:hypothetical protein
VSRVRGRHLTAFRPHGLLPDFDDKPPTARGGVPTLSSIRIAASGQCRRSRARRGDALRAVSEPSEPDRSSARSAAGYGRSQRQQP